MCGSLCLVCCLWCVDFCLSRHACVVVPCLVCIVGCMLFVDCCVLLVRCLLFVVSWPLLVAGCVSCV